MYFYAKTTRHHMSNRCVQNGHIHQSRIRQAYLSQLSPPRGRALPLTVHYLGGYITGGGWGRWTVRHQMAPTSGAHPPGRYGLSRLGRLTPSALNMVGHQHLVGTRPRGWGQVRGGWVGGSRGWLGSGLGLGEPGRFQSLQVDGSKQDPERWRAWGISIGCID